MPEQLRALSLFSGIQSAAWTGPRKLVRYRSDALERAVQEYLEIGTDEARERLERMVE